MTQKNPESQNKVRKAIQTTLSVFPLFAACIHLIYHIYFIIAMTHFQKLKRVSLLNWVSSFLSERRLNSSNIGNFLTPRTLYAAKNPIFYSSRLRFSSKASLSETSEEPTSQIQSRIRRVKRTEAEAALFDYLHCTRSIPFTDAEHISKCSPHFLNKILVKIEKEQEVGRSLTRFLRYHPINEFEPFFESLGLKPSEFSLLLPRKLMFLCDDALLLENYHVLCNYGVVRGKIGKIYKEATSVFQCDYGVLGSKLRAYEELGLSETSVIKLAACSPSLLIGNGVSGEFVQVLEKLKSLGIKSDWILGHLLEKNSYDWSNIRRFLYLFSEMGYSNEELRVMITRHPGFLLDGSGKSAHSLIEILLKLGVGVKEIRNLFLQFPQVRVGAYAKNLRQGLVFLFYIKMEPEGIGEIMRTHHSILGTSSLKKPNTILSKLRSGKKQVCDIIKDDPNQLKNWVLGSKTSPLPRTGDDQISMMQKIEFLLNLGFVENSVEMKEALKVFRGRGCELQEKFDCLVKVGLDPNDVSRMVKALPHFLNQTRDVIEKKIDFFINSSGYPLESLVVFPHYMKYTIQRVKFRFSMYNWLKERGVAKPSLALSTVLACSDTVFLNQYVKHHPQVPEVWDKYKKIFSSDSEMY